MPGLEPLTTTEDASRLGYTLDTESLEGQILRVSAKLRADVGQTFTQVEDDVVSLWANKGHVLLPQRPVTAVTSVTVAGGQAVAGWQLAGNVLLLPRRGTWALPVANGPDSDCLAGRPDQGLVTVTYSHGYDQVPDDVQAAVFDVIDQVRSNPDGVRSLSIDDFTASLTDYGATTYYETVVQQLRRRYAVRAKSKQLR